MMKNKLNDFFENFMYLFLLSSKEILVFRIRLKQNAIS